MAVSGAEFNLLQEGAFDAASLVAVGPFFDSWILALLVHSILLMMHVSGLT
jgi:hypothetical protein